MRLIGIVCLDKFGISVEHLKSLLEVDGNKITLGYAFVVDAYIMKT